MWRTQVESRMVPRAEGMGSLVGDPRATPAKPGVLKGHALHVSPHCLQEPHLQTHKFLRPLQGSGAQDVGACLKPEVIRRDLGRFWIQFLGSHLSF